MTGPVLRDIHVPPAAWWPVAPGWWVVAGLALLLVAVVAWWLWRRMHARMLRAALCEIDRMQKTFVRDRDLAGLVVTASRLLRRIALRIDPAAAAVHGEAWRAFLHGRTRDQRVAAVLDDLVDAPFRARPEIDARELLRALRHWCKHAVRAPRARRRWLAWGWRARAGFPAAPGRRMKSGSRMG